MVPITLEVNSKKEYRSKRSLSEFYQIDMKTLNKWVRYFAPKVIQSWKFKEKRKLSIDLYFQLVQTFGTPDNEFEVMRKQQIAKEADSTYFVVRDNIKKFSDKYPISLEVYDNMSVFPPVVARKLIECLE
jgi:hypothetical protein